MAERRMFTQKIIDSDAFLDMPLSTQALYFHLNMRADDDGFVNNPKRIQRTIGASDDDLKLLIAKRFTIGFECGVIVIKHWRMHNTLRKDRYNPTQYQEELAMLDVKDNNAYTEKNPALPVLEESVATTWQPNGNQVATQYSIGKDSIVKLNICDEKAEEKPKRTRFSPPTVDEVKAYCKERNNNVDAERFIDYYNSNGWMVGKNKMKDWKAAVRTWENNGYGSGTRKNQPKETKSRSYDIEAYERMIYAEENPPKTVADDPKLRKRAESLMQRLVED